MGKLKNAYVIAYTANNLGDDMFVFHLCNKYPLTLFHLVCPKEFQESFQLINNIQLYESEYAFISHIAKQSIHLDMQIYIGGSIFMQPQDDSQILSKIDSVKQKRLFKHIPFSVLGANFGPFTKQNHLDIYTEWFSEIDDICFRDKYSYDLFSSASNIRWAPDILLNYPLSLDTKTSNIISISCIHNNGRIGLPQYSESDYINALLAIAENYYELGYTIQFASFCNHQKDAYIANEIGTKMQNHERIKFLSYSNNIDGFLKAFLNSKYIIGTRFHSVILGWLAGIPTFPIAYNTKMLHVLQDYRFDGNWTYIDDLKNLNFEYINNNFAGNNVFNCEALVKQSNAHFNYLDQYLT